MFLILEYIDDFSLSGKGTKTKEISVFAVQEVTERKGGCTVKLIGSEFRYRLNISKEEFKQQCADALKATMPAPAAPPPAPPAGPATDEPGGPAGDPAPKKLDTLIIDVKEKEEEEEPENTKMI